MSDVQPPGAALAQAAAPATPPTTNFGPDLLLAASRAAPLLDPAIHVGVASTAADPTTAATNAQTVAGFGSYTTWANSLGQMSQGAQEQVWGALPDSERQNLTAAGYKLAPKPKGGPGFFGKLASGDIGGALGAGVADVVSLPGQAWKGTLQDLGAGLHAVQHVFRASHFISASNTTMGESGTSGLLSTDTLKGLIDPGPYLANLNPSQWAKAWDRTEHGDKTYDPLVVRQLTDRYGPQTVGEATLLADTGMSAAGLAALYASLPDKGASLKAGLAGPLGDVTKLLAASRISIGRAVVGAKFSVDHPDLAKPISGGIDAAYDWFADPLNAGVGGLHAASDVPYLIRGPADVARLTNADPLLGQVYPKVQHALDVVDDYLRAPTTLADGTAATGDFAGLANRFPSLVTSGLDQKIADGTMTGRDDFVNWMSGQSGIEAMLAGRALPTSKVATEAGAIGTMLRAGPLSDLAFDAKSHLTDAIDFASDKPILGGPARSIARVTKLIPAVDSFNPDAPNAAGIVRQVAQLALNPTDTDAVVNAWAHADGTDAKRRIYKSLLDTMGDIIGINENPVTAERWAKMTDQATAVPTADNGFRPRIYSSGVDDRLPIDGQQVPSGILAHQVQGRWAIPDYRDMMAAKYKVTLGDHLLAGINNDGVDAFMQQGWKPLQLLRLGFAPRIAGEELAGALLRDGPLGLAKARLAWSSVAGERADEIATASVTGQGLGASADKLSPWHPMAHVWSALTDHLPASITDHLLPPDMAGDKEFWAQMMGDRARRAFRNVEGKLATPEYVQGARELYDAGYGVRAFGDEITANHSGGLTYVESPHDQIRASRSMFEKRRVELQPSGDFTDYEQADPLFLQIYNRDLNQIATDPLGRAALVNHGHPDQQVQDVIDRINAPDMAQIRKSANRYSVLRDGRVVGLDATQDEAVRDWANAVVDHVNYHIPADGPANHILDPPSMLRDARAPDVNTLATIHPDDLPLAVHGPETLPVVGAGLYRQLLTKGFSEMVGRPMDWMARQPMFLHNYVLAKREIEPFRAFLAADALDKGAASGVTDVSPYIDDHMAHLAAERAVNKTIPFIHDPAVRSQFAVNVRNLAPFEFAQEQFLKRWARTFNYAPEALRQAQLINSGIRHSGLTHVDPNGNEYFDYPVIGRLEQAVIAPAWKLLTGQDVSIPTLPGFTGDVKYLSPGLDRIGAPSWGPLVSMPVKALAQRFPELAPADAAIEGSRGVNTGFIQQIVPSTVSRVWEALMANPDSSAQMASAVAQAAKALDASGHGLGDNFSTADKQAYIDRLTNWARLTMLMRAFVGFAGPSAPSITAGDQKLPNELRVLMASMPLNEAMATFIKQNPDANAFTVFGTTSKGKAELPAAADTLNFMDANQGFLSKYPLAAGWFLPSSGGKFDQAAELEQLAMGLRQRKPVGKIIDDITFARASGVYYQSDTAYQQAKLAAKGNPAATSALDRAWTTWKDAYFVSHPVFAEILQSSTAKVDRGKILDDITHALADPNVPKSPQTDALNVLTTSFARMNAARLNLTAQHTAIANTRKLALENAFAQWGAQFLTANPGAEAVYDRLIRPDIGGDVALAQSVAANTETQAVPDPFAGVAA